MSRKEIKHLIGMSRNKAGITTGGHSLAFRRTVTAAAVIAIAAACFGSAVLFETVQAAANEDDGLPYRIINDSLRVGKYYADGDTSASYIEIYDDGTLQWKGIDHYEYAKEQNIKGAELHGLEWNEDMEDATVELAGQYAARHAYTVVYWKSPEVTMLMYDWDENSEHLGGTGCVYIDENTIEAHGMTFIYTEE